jgi:D-threo-aldose 1-dehydrogenase
LESAYEAGIRHFDVAPMYGMGLAETELAPFLKGRRAEVTVTTKFGIDVSIVGRGAGWIQGPVRAVLARRPELGQELKMAGSGPGSGWFGKVLYSSTGYNAQSAERSLTRSLRALRTDYVDILELHDPVGDLVSGAPELVAYLDRQQERGQIRCWGVTGSPTGFRGATRDVAEHAQVLQFRDDIFEPRPDVQTESAKAWITYGLLERTLPALQGVFAQNPDRLAIWNGRFGLDLSDPAVLPSLLLREALRRNRAGPVLVSSVRSERVDAWARMASDSQLTFNTDEEEAIKELAVWVTTSTQGLCRPL